jgi:pre-mRNA 3'-end-processing factor FIP1
MGFPMPDGPPPPMPGMNPEMMQNMLARMMAQGLDPSSMVPMSFMDHAQAMRPNQSGAGDGQQGQFGGQGGGIEVSMAVDKDGGDGGSRACGWVLHDVSCSKSGNGSGRSWSYSTIHTTYFL